MSVVAVRVLDLNETIQIYTQPFTPHETYPNNGMNTEEEHLRQRIREVLNVPSTQTIQLLREDQMWLCCIS